MPYRAPDTLIDSSEDELSFQSPASINISDRMSLFEYSQEGRSNMTQEQQSGSQIPQEQPSPEFQQSDSNIAYNIPPEVYQTICEKVTQQILSQLRNSPAQSVNPPPNHQSPQIQIPTQTQLPPPVLQREASKWPVWDGNSTTFEAHVYSLRVKIEEDRQLLGSDRSICFNIFNSVPTEKRLRIQQWFQKGGPDGSHNWQAFLTHFNDQFENKQARQTSRSQLQRMRMGTNQYFHDFLQDFELKISQCGSSGYTDEMKISLLETAINPSLTNLLLNKSLPDNDYPRWISKVKRVAGRLENTPSYCPKGYSGKRTWYLQQNFSSNHFTPGNSTVVSRPVVDADGDTRMGGVNTAKIAKAVINALGGKGLLQSQDKPAAKWRSAEDFRQLLSEGRCIRCAQTGHKTRLCPKYGPAKRTTNMAHIKSHEDVDINSSSNDDEDIARDSDNLLSGEE